MQLYQERNICPFYSVKILFGFLIQIAIFIAVFDVLGESIYLLEKSFFFIDDLSKPDQWLSLPIVIPFLGSSFNLLPFCMMIISLLSAFLYHDRNLSSDLLSNQKRNLYFMSLLFFILLFTFPSGMVFMDSFKHSAITSDANKKGPSVKGLFSHPRGLYIKNP